MNDAQPTRDRFRAEVRGPDGRVKGTHVGGPPPTGNGSVNVVEVVKALLLRKLTEEFGRKEFREEIVRAANLSPGEETEIGIFLSLEPGHLRAVCEALVKSRAAQAELERAVRSYAMVKVH